MTEPIPAKETQVIPPQQRYQNLLSTYATQADALRENAKLHRPLDQVRALDQRHHDVHNRLKHVATQLGKSEDDLWLDILNVQGNLKEYGIDAPLIRLPMVGVYFKGGREAGTIARPREEKVTPRYAKIRNMHALFSADGKRITEVLPPPQGYEDTQTETINGNKAEIEKWDHSPYFLILYSDMKHDWHGQYEQPLHDFRMIRRKHLAKDFGLHLATVYDLSGHNNFGEHSADGVEVPQSRVTEIAKAIGTNKQKYWLTDAELQHPENAMYTDTDIAGLSSQDCLSALYVVQKRAAEHNNWQSWRNILLLYSRLIDTGWKPASYHTVTQEWELGPQTRPIAHNMDINKEISKAIVTLEQTKPEVAKELQDYLNKAKAFHTSVEAERKIQ